MALSKPVLKKKPFHLVIIGPSGGGKGTQAKLLAKEFGLSHLSSGNFLRQEIASGSKMGKEISLLLKEGKWVSDEIILRVIKPHLEAGIKKGFILDGSPRTVKQAEILEDFFKEKGVRLDAALFLKVGSEIIIQRWKAKVGGGRRFQPGRADDNLVLLEKRIASYQKTIKPILDFYREKGLLITVDGEKSVEAIYRDIVSRLRKIGA